MGHQWVTWELFSRNEGGGGMVFMWKPCSSKPLTCVRFLPQFPKMRQRSIQVFRGSDWLEIFEITIADFLCKRIEHFQINIKPSLLLPNIFQKKRFSEESETRKIGRPSQLLIRSRSRSWYTDRSKNGWEEGNFTLTLYVSKLRNEVALCTREGTTQQFSPLDVICVCWPSNFVFDKHASLTKAIRSSNRAKANFKFVSPRMWIFCKLATIVVFSRFDSLLDHRLDFYGMWINCVRKNKRTIPHERTLVHD